MRLSELTYLFLWASVGRSIFGPLKTHIGRPGTTMAEATLYKYYSVETKKVITRRRRRQFHIH